MLSHEGRQRLYVIMTKAESLGYIKYIQFPESARNGRYVFRKAMVVRRVKIEK